MSGLHHLAFEPKVRFIRHQDDAGHWGECVVCGESFFGVDAVALDEALAKHRGHIHVVMVYPYGMPRPPARRRRSRAEAPPEVAHG